MREHVVTVTVVSTLLIVEYFILTLFAGAL